MAEARIQTQCEGCGATVTFPSGDLGTVQECPECGGYLDVPEITRVPTVYEMHSEAYARRSEESERQLRRSGEQQEETDRQLRRGGEQQVEIDRQILQTAQQLEQVQRQLDQRDRLAALEAQLLDRLAQVLGRWEVLASRVEQALADFENRPHA